MYKLPPRSRKNKIGIVVCIMGILWFGAKLIVSAEALF